MKLIETDGINIKSWCPDIEEKAMEQMKLIATLPYVKESCLMPDCHLGMDCCVGGVVACENVVVPNFVGSDAGCGMAAIRTNLTEEDMTDSSKKILFNLLSQAIPVGFSHNTDKRRRTLETTYCDKMGFAIDKSKIPFFEEKFNPVGDYEKEIASQLGTLGGG